jgi:hypothetical protein
MIITQIRIEVAIVATSFHTRPELLKQLGAFPSLRAMTEIVGRSEAGDRAQIQIERGDTTTHVSTQCKLKPDKNHFFILRSLSSTYFSP